MSRFVVLTVLAVSIAFRQASAQDGYNPRAVEDIKAFLAKAEEGDGLFNQKKYAEAAAALAAGHDLYLRAFQRDSGVGYYKISLKPDTHPAIRYYGYGFSSVASLAMDPAGAITGSAAGLHRASNDMWKDAAILGGLAKCPQTAFDDAELIDITESEINSAIFFIVNPLSAVKLPVPDHEWHSVVVWSRRALLLVEYALQRYPEWKSGARSWGRINGELTHTGDAALADIKAKLAEAEPEYAKIVAEAKKAQPKYAKTLIDVKLEDLDKAIAGVKQNGWLPWNMARDIFVDKDYVSDMRKGVAKIYADEGKTMPTDALKTLEDKVAALKSAMESGASKWKFPAGKPKNATFESKAAASVKARFAGSTILKTALDSGQWIITKNELDIPRYRSMGVLVLVKIPGQKHPWLVFGYVRQSYSGGGTYISGGTYGEPNDVRMQAGG